MVISSQFFMDRDPSLREAKAAKPIFLRNHPTAFEEAVIVTAAVAASVTTPTIWALKCILPLGVVFNSH